MKHALVIGGTGMLADLSLWLLANGYHVSVIARNEQKMNRLISKSGVPDRISPIYVDYHNDLKLEEAVLHTIEDNGPIDVVVSWIHSTAPKALKIISEIVSIHAKESWDLYHVRGSSYFISKEAVDVPGNCVYHAVYLGFIIEGNHSRWLTNKEISTGVISAILTGMTETVVGTMEPWEMRP